MKLLVVLLVLPCVLAGDFAKMWAEVEKELEAKGWGEELKEKSEESKGWGEEPKGWGEEHKGWGEEHKGPSSEKNETDTKKEESIKEEKPFNEEHKGWGEKPKGWGEEHKGWGEKPKGWGEEHKGSGGKGNESQAENSTKNTKKSLFEDFKTWLTQQDSQKKELEEYKEYLKVNVEKFNDYMKMKQYKEKQEQEAKDAIKKEMEKVQMKKLLTEKLYNVSTEYLAQKMKFTQEITSHFLEFCQCDSSKDLFERVTKGHFGDIESAGNSWDFEMDDSSEERYNSSNNGSMAVYSEAPSSSNFTPTPEDGDKMKETVMWFAKLSPKEQAKHVLHDLVKVMCTSATHYMGEMKKVEAALIEHKKKYYHHE